MTNTLAATNKIPKKSHISRVHGACLINNIQHIFLLLPIMKLGFEAFTIKFMMNPGACIITLIMAVS